MAFDGITVGGIEIGVPPVSVTEPGTLFIFGFALTALLRRRKVI
ncbi:PEP-CTERM sorting domain-containing protein [Rheinheimera salexigens]